MELILKLLSIPYLLFYFYYLTSAFNTQFKKDNNIEAIMALINPVKTASGTRKNASFNTIALITKENKPKVKTVIGKDKNFITGLTVLFNTPITIDNIIKVPIEPIYIPLIK